MDRVSVVLTKEDGSKVTCSPLNLKLQEKILTPYATASLSFKGCLFGFNFCEIYVNDTLVFKGPKATERVTTTAEGNQTDFVFKSIGVALEINQAEPKVWTNPTFNQLMDYYAIPLGDFYSTAANTTMTGDFEISGGINVWTIFLQYMRKMYYHHPHIDIDGRIMTMSVLKGQQYSASLLPITESSFVCDKNGLCTQVYGRFRGSQEFYMLIENSVAKNMGVNRNRLILQENLSVLELMERARSIVLQSNLKNAYGLISLYGHTPITLWDEIAFNTLNIPAEFKYVGKKEWTYSPKKGSITNLYLYPITFVDIYE